MMKCISCGHELTHDEIGLTKKLINRGATQYYCLNCLSEKFRCSTELLEKKIEQFRKQGCTLFIAKTDN